MKQRQERKRASSNRRKKVERFLYDAGWQQLDRLDEWDGQDLEFLRRELGEEQFAALLDHLGESEREES
jgi:hypothetical protein